ncbi:MAG: DUF92 domain-containing protein [Anaerolineae bacterium]|nr:DUF92 domain-containing protein [Thermoflexales bacterium]MDW8407540.1 DUF92 domain-containing protein [Anaerolineae bacterium]
MDQAGILTTRLAFGAVLSALIGWLAHRRGSLSRSGIAGAVITGTLIFGMGGLLAGLLLIAFFTSSSALSHYKASRKRDVAEKFDKSSQRDLGQALANGGAATIAATVSGVWLWSAPLEPAFIATPAILFGALVGALATVNADTWATEIGVLSKHPPRLIIRPGQVVEAGTSGGVTLLGTLAALAGAVFIGAMTLMLGLLLMESIHALVRAYGVSAATMSRSIDAGVWVANILPVTPNDLSASRSILLSAALAAPVAGVVGALTDSVLGATVQGIYYDAARRKETEKPFNQYGAPNRLSRGWRWLNNDWVNFLSSLAGAAVGALAVALSLSR